MNKLIFILSAILLLFAACEYEPGGQNFVELTPPEDIIPLEISLNDINPSDTIYIYKNTQISIKISTPINLRQAVVLLDGKPYENMGSKTYGFTLYPERIKEGVHKLTVDAAFTSGTGSLAEMMGMEGYKGELSWTICVIHNPQGRFKVNYRVNEEGFFEVHWNNAIPDSYIKRYTIDLLLTQEPLMTINDAQQKSFVDYGYVCKYAIYEVKTYLKDGTIFTRTLSIDIPAPKIYFEDLGIDSLRVYWDQPFTNAKINLIEGNKTIATEIKDTSIIVPQVFGKTREFQLEILPLKAGYDYYQTQFSDWGKFRLGTSLGLPNSELYAYSIKDNIIFTSKYDHLVALDATSLREINTVSITGHPWGFIYGGKMACAPHNSTVAAMTGEETWIFTDSRFLNPIIIPSLPGDVNTRLCALTSNDRLFVVQQDATVCKIFNSLTGAKILDLSFTYKTIYTFPDFAAVSENGQFFCASSENGIEIFEINGTTTKLLYTDTRYYKGAMFVPSQPDQLLMRVGTAIEIRQLPDFNLIQTLDVSANGAFLCNIDPASKSLLYHQNDSLKVCKIDNLAETIFKIKSDEKTSKMFNNKLLTRGFGGICLDINPYLHLSTD